jgi:hypothetical protein
MNRFSLFIPTFSQAVRYFVMFSWKQEEGGRRGEERKAGQRREGGTGETEGKREKRGRSGTMCL